MYKNINGFVLKKWDIPQVMAIEMPKNIQKQHLSRPNKNGSEFHGFNLLSP
jgi:hypothetical protein